MRLVSQYMVVTMDFAFLYQVKLGLVITKNQLGLVCFGHHFVSLLQPSISNGLDELPNDPANYFLELRS